MPHGPGDVQEEEPLQLLRIVHFDRRVAAILHVEMRQIVLQPLHKGEPREPRQRFAAFRPKLNHIQVYMILYYM